MRKNKYITTEAPNRAKDTEFSKFRSWMAKVDYRISQRNKAKKVRGELPKRHKRDNNYIDD